MIDPDFQPYELLIDCLQQLHDHTDVINRLIRAHNEQEQLMVELTKQHRTVTQELLKSTKRMQQLEVHYSILKKELDEIKRSSTTGS